MVIDKNDSKTRVSHELKKVDYFIWIVHFFFVNLLP